MLRGQRVTHLQLRSLVDVSATYMGHYQPGYVSLSNIGFAVDPNSHKPKDE